MLPLIDTHVHLLAGLDDGPQTMEEAIAMCRILAADGVGITAALAHQNDGYPDNLPDRIRAACTRLQTALKTNNIPIQVCPTGEVMATADLLSRHDQGRLQTVGDHGKYLLVEMPHGLFLDLRPMAELFRPKGVRLIVAHAERYPELLHDYGLAELWIQAGCLIQVTAGELANPISSNDARALKDWAKRGVIHMLGSDGHNLTLRPPRMKAGYEVLRKWIGDSGAERIGNLWPSAIMEGRLLEPPAPLERKRTWFSWLMGS